MTPSDPVIVVGAGLAGLCCARELAAAGVPCTLLEAGDAVGGRVRTDEVEGFLLDRGFQVFLTAYPEARRVLDYAALDLRTFLPGALVRTDAGGDLRRVIDPWRHPIDGAKSLLSGVIGVPDVLPMTRLRMASARTSAEVEGVDSSLWRMPERTTLEELQNAGLSPRAIDGFFRPFFGGVFFDRELTTSSRMFRFTFKMFAEGDAALPARGMRAIPDQLAASLRGRVELHLRTAAEQIGPSQVRTRDGRTLPASAVVVAADGTDAQRLLGDAPGDGGIDFPGWRSSATLSFAADKPPIDEPILVLDGVGAGPINHLCVPSNVAPAYAPRGAALVSATIVNEPAGGWVGVETAARDQLRAWFGAAVDRWRLLRMDRIPRSLPRQGAGALEPPRRPVRLRPGLYVCGDHRDNASINGAMESGRRAAEAVIADLAGGPR